MCKNGALPDSEKDRQQTAETVNVGLINSSSKSFNKIPIWEIVEILKTNANSTKTNGLSDGNFH
jgi:hypothetical protein